MAKLSKKLYEKKLEELQNELVNLQDWVVHKGLKVVILFEGRDAAGKGGAIKRIAEKLNCYSQLKQAIKCLDCLTESSLV
jgi:polyphosphate kinase 2 (PPK2 family)